MRAWPLRSMPQNLPIRGCCDQGASPQGLESWYLRPPLGYRVSTCVFIMGTDSYGWPKVTQRGRAANNGICDQPQPIAPSGWLPAEPPTRWGFLDNAAGVVGQVTISCVRT
jgi:hypothetical protein